MRLAMSSLRGRRVTAKCCQRTSVMIRYGSGLGSGVMGGGVRPSRDPSVAVTEPVSGVVDGLDLEPFPTVGVAGLGPPGVGRVVKLDPPLTVRVAGQLPGSGEVDHGRCRFAGPMASRAAARLARLSVSSRGGSSFGASA